MTIGEEKLTFLQRARDWDWQKVGLWELGISLFFGTIVTVIAGLCFPQATLIDVMPWFVGWLIVLVLLNRFFFGGAVIEECLSMLPFSIMGEAAGFVIGLVIIEIF